MRCFCDNLFKNSEIKSPHHLIELISEIKKTIDDKIIAFETGNCTPDEINNTPIWPRDFIHQEYRCLKCGIIFILDCETYHGFGGSFREKQVYTGR